MITIVTASNERYMDKMRPYLESLARHLDPASARAVLVCVDCAAPDWLPPEIGVHHAPRSLLAGSPAGTESLQHGAWLQVVPGEPEDVVIFTDGDIFFQRPFDAVEIAALADWPDNSIGASYNQGSSETLLDEALFKLGPRQTDGEFLNRWGRITLQGTCFNIGVMVARRSTYQRLYDLYMGQWKRVSKALSHQARQQWLMGYLMHKEGFEIRLLPYNFHMHYHFELPAGALVGLAGDAYWQNQRVLFWHVPLHRRRTE
jgi:hypothetical protein